MYPIKFMRYVLNLDVGRCCRRIDIEDDVVDFVLLRLFMNEVRMASSLIGGQAGLLEVRVGEFHDTQIITMASESEKDTLYSGTINIGWRCLDGRGRPVNNHREV